MFHDDTLKNIGLAGLGLLLFSVFIQSRTEHAIQQDLKRNFKTGEFKASVEGRGLLGHLIADSSLTVIKGRGFTTPGIPFRVMEGGGLKARVRRLVLDFEDITLGVQPVRRFRAELPNMSIDLMRSFFKEETVIRGAGVGTAETLLNENDLKIFIERKYKNFSNIEVKLNDGMAYVKADVNIPTGSQRIETLGKIGIKDEAFLVLENPSIKVNGEDAAPAYARFLLTQINPVVDIQADLGLGEFLKVRNVEITRGYIRVSGVATIPKAKPKAEKTVAPAEKEELEPCCLPI